MPLISSSASDILLIKVKSLPHSAPNMKHNHSLDLDSPALHYRIKLARRITQLASLLISIPLLAFLFFAGRLDILAALLFLALASSLVVGRAFCSWLCPLGTLYELSRLGLPYKRLRPLCRLGCPYSLILGLMNRFSSLKVKKNEDKCKHCGTCDASCPVGLPDLGTDYQNFTSNPSKRYACIRCLNCVASCPADALTFGK